MSNFKAFLKAGHARTWAEKGGRARTTSGTAAVLTQASAAKR